MPLTETAATTACSHYGFYNNCCCGNNYGHQHTALAHKLLLGGANAAASRCGEGWGLDLFEEGAEFAEVAAAHLNVDFVEGRTQAAALCGVFDGG